MIKKSHKTKVDTSAKETSKSAETSAKVVVEEQEMEQNDAIESTDNQEGTEEEVSEPLSELDQLQAELAGVQAARADIQDKFLRMMAEFDNFKKRTAREKRELRETAAEDLIVDLLTVVDDFDRAFKAMDETAKETPTDEETERQGMKLIIGKFKTVLENRGLVAMDAQDKDFDPDWHEAITEIPAPSKKQKGKVVDVIEKGYLLGEKIIRYAKVVVGK